MRTALRSTWPIVLTGTALTAATALGAYLVEQNALAKRAKVQAGFTLERAAAQLKQEGDNVQLALQYITASKARPDDLPGFLRKLTFPYFHPTKEAEWLWLKSYPNMEKAKASELFVQDMGRPATLSGGDAAPISPVIYNDRQDRPPALGYNLANEEWFKASFASFGKVPSYRIVPAGQSKLWPDGALVAGAADGTGNYMLRAIPETDLGAITLLDQGQSINIFDDAKPDETIGLGGGKRKIGFLTAAIASSPTTKIGLPVVPDKPVTWLPVTVMGLFITAIASLVQAGKALGQRTRQMGETLADTRQTEQIFFDAGGAANCVIEGATSRLVRVNEAMCQMFGYSRSELIGKTLSEITHPDDVSSTRARNDLLNAAPDKSMQFEKRYLDKAGNVLWCIVNTRTFTLGPQKNVYFASAIIDITERKREESLRNELVKELAHRVRNTVQLTASIARQTGKTATSVRDFELKFQQRLNALNAAQNALFDANWASVSFKDLAQRALAPFMAQQAGRLTVDLPDVAMTAQEAQTMAIALNELAANAASHGALAHGGTIFLTGKREGKDLSLDWRENYKRSSASPPSSRGFGMHMLLSALPVQFGGEASLEWLPGGMAYRATLPLSG